MNAYVKALSEFFNRQTWLDPAAESLQKVINSLTRWGGPLGQKIADALNGVWLGHPLHPVLTDIPVGAWTAAVALDAMDGSTGSAGVAKAAVAAVAIGVAGAVGSAVTGFADWQYTTGETRRAGMMHAVLNTTALTMFLGSMAARAGGNRGLGKNLALVGYAIAGVSAYIGGDMVFRQRMGVNHAPDEEELVVQDFVPVLAEDQLPEGQLTIALLTNTPLVLLREGSRVYALAETCAHLGGPLADGRISRGPNGEPLVVCPWHESHFNMENGVVVKGPSAYPQPCFEARINDGQVEVRRRRPEQ